MPLDPVYNNRNNLVTAKKELDESIIDILSMFMRFDLADLLSRVGTNNDFGANWAHTLAYLRIRYPVQDYIDYMHEYLKLLETLGSFMDAKKEALATINDAMKNRFAALKNLYRKNLIQTNNYRPDSFDSEVEEVIRRAGKFEAEFKKQVRGLEDFALNYNQRWTKVLQAMAFGPETAEYSVVQGLTHWHQQISNLGAHLRAVPEGHPALHLRAREQHHREQVPHLEPDQAGQELPELRQPRRHLSRDLDALHQGQGPR